MLNLMKIIEKKVPNGGVTFAGLTTYTEVKLLGGKKNPHQGRVTKRTIANVMLGANYETMVQRRLYKEGEVGLEFEVDDRKWGTRIGKSCFITHNEGLYLECIFKSVTSVIYYLDGVEVDKETIQGIRPTQEAEQGGLEDKVILRTYAAVSIERITIGGETFE